MGSENFFIFLDFVGKDLRAPCDVDIFTTEHTELTEKTRYFCHRFTQIDTDNFKVKSKRVNGKSVEEEFLTRIVRF
jgi:hypothetical protein